MGDDLSVFHLQRNIFEHRYAVKGFLNMVEFQHDRTAPFFGICMRLPPALPGDGVYGTNPVAGIQSSSFEDWVIIW